MLNQCLESVSAGDEGAMEHSRLNLRGAHVESLKLHLHRSGQTKPETIVTIPLAMLAVSVNLIPKRIQDSLEKLGIDVIGLSQLAGKKTPRGVLIEIEQSNEKIVISVD